MFKMLWVLNSGIEAVILQQFSLYRILYFVSIFSGIVWIDKVHNRVEENCLNVSHENRKKTLSHFSC